MAIGRFRDTPAEMDDIECEVAAAQYPEGGLVVGIGLGIMIAVLTVPMLVVVTPFVFGIAGFGLGRVVRHRRLQTLRAARDGQE